MNDEFNYGFLDYDYYDEYNHDPLYVLIINEQLKMLRNSFYLLDNDTKNVLDYFIIQRKNDDYIDVDIDNYIDRLKNIYFNMCK